MDNDLDLVVEVISAYAQKNKMNQNELIETIRAVHDLFVELRAENEAPTPENSANDADLTDTREPLFEVDAPVSYFHGVNLNDDDK